MDMIEEEEEDDDDDDDDPSADPWPLALPARRSESRQADAQGKVVQLDAYRQQVPQRIAALVALQQLMAQGMNVMPGRANGGLAWLLQTLKSIDSSGLFGKQAGQLLPGNLTGQMATFESQYVGESKQAGAQFTKRTGNEPTMPGIYGPLIKAVAFGGAATATALGVRKGLSVLSGPRFSGLSPGARGGGGGGKIFRAPTFRPGFQRRMRGFQFSGNPPTD